MDLNILPACAMYRSVGTVLVRIRMEGCCAGHKAATGSGRPDPVHIPSGCERCIRTRLISKHNSDCDSVVESCRPYRSSTARSRYVNVCAAVCLLLLVGGLTPQSSAAPHQSRKMDRQKREASKENPLWANPCDYTSDSPIARVNSKELATNLFRQAKSALTSASNYKDTLALTLQSFKTFDALLPVWSDFQWLRKVSWHRDEVLPKEKKLFETIPNEYVEGLMPKIDDILPDMFKSLKYIVAGLHKFSTDGLRDDLNPDVELKKHIKTTMHAVRAVLCIYHEIMKARQLPILPLDDADTPDFSKAEDGVLLYIDTLNYLEYLVLVFEKLSETD